jgi:hypothetical protein
MKKTIFYGIGIMSLMLSATSCGGGEEESTEESSESTEEVLEEVVEPVTYTVDTAQSIINWVNYDGEDHDHTGTVKLLEGTYTDEGGVITAATLTMDMNSITADSEKLQGHLGAADFFDINQFASSEFVFDRHEEGVLYGVVNAAGLEFSVEAGVTVVAGEVAVDEFRMDLSSLPYFVAEREENPEEEWHNPSVGFTVTIVAE